MVVLLTVLLGSVFALIYRIEIARAIETIYIMPDGTITPSTAPLSTMDNVTYILTEDINASISVGRDNIVVDGLGHKLRGTGWLTWPSETGLDLTRRVNVTVKNFELRNFWCGIYLEYAWNNSIYENNITDSGVGIRLVRSPNNTLSGNVIENNTLQSVYIYESSHTALRNNDMVSNRWNFAVHGFRSGDFIQDIDTSNKVNGRPIYYLVSQRDITIPSDAGYVGLINSFNITVEGAEFTNVEPGVILVNTSNSIVANSTMANTMFFGIRLLNSSGNIIYGNNITQNYKGLQLSSSANNTILGNSITENNRGIWIEYSPGNRLRSNVMMDNDGNFVVYGLDILDFIQDMDASNMVDGRPAYYWVNKHGTAVPSDAGYVALVNCTSIIVKNLYLTKNGQGMLIAFTTNSTITQNNIIDNHGHGIELENSFGNRIFGNHIVDNTWDGVSLWHSSLTNKIHGNNLESNYFGIGFYYHCNNNDIIGNNIANNWYGISLQAESSYNVISANIISNSRYDGMWLWDSSNNFVYHNNFVNNTRAQVGDIATVIPAEPFSTNSWDVGYPYGGTYWSNYNGTDLYSGALQNQSGSDGIGDMSYTVNEKNTDMYPLMGYFGPLTTKGINTTVFPTEKVAVIFENVVISGFTDVEEIEIGPELPSGYQVVGKYQDVQTTATYLGKIKARIIYDDSHMTKEDEKALELMQWNEISQEWATITTRIDAESNVIYGETSHLSIFGVTRRSTPVIPANVEVSSDGLNLKGKGSSITAYIELSEGYNVHDIKVSTILIDDAIPVDMWLPMEFGDYDDDTISDLKVSFNRTKVIEYLLSKNITQGNVTLALTGDLNRFGSFEGSVSIAVSNIVGDANCDGIVNLYDLILAVTSYSSQEGESRWNPNVNFAPSWETIDIFDLVTLAYHYGEAHP